MEVREALVDVLGPRAGEAVHHGEDLLVFGQFRAGGVGGNRTDGQEATGDEVDASAEDAASAVDVSDDSLEDGDPVVVGERQVEDSVQALEVDHGEADLDRLGRDAPEGVL